MALLNNGISGLLSAQRALATVSHNIANVNTDGYSRQETLFVSREPQFTGAGYLGRGVTIDSIRRIQSEFLTEQIRTSTASSNASSTFFDLASRVDNILADEQTGLAPTLQNFFNAMQDVTDLPSGLDVRQILLSEGQSLAARFQFIDEQLENFTQEIRLEIQEAVAEVNSFTSAIANLNEQIVQSQGDLQTQPPNDLLDRRDELIRQLSEYIAVSTIEQSDGSLNVFTGKGQSLVLGNNANALSLTEPYFGQFEISITTSFGNSAITQTVTGGKLGGLLDFQNNMLEPARNSLGRLAIGFAETFNQQHNLGINLDGEVDVDFFNVGLPQAISLGSANPALLNVSITDVADLSDSDYRLRYDGGNNYTLTRLSDNTSTAIDTLGGSPFVTSPIDGLALTLTAGGTAGDEYIIRPTINGAADIAVAITNVNKIAAGAPLKSSEGTDANGIPNNIGTAEISDVSITNTSGIPLTSNVTLTFDAALNRFDISAPPGGTLAYDPATESNGKSFSIAALGGATFSINGVPQDGDSFSIENNTNAPGDNRNALELSLLQADRILNGGTLSYLESYSQIVADVGIQTRQAEISSEALETLLDSAIENRESIAGVNLDEEAADILKLQQAYQAAAQVITTADRLFQTLIQAF